MVVVALLAVTGCAKENNSSFTWGPFRSVLESSAQIEAFRIKMPVGNENAAYTDWPVARGPVDVDVVTGRQLATILLDPKSYSDTPKPCEPMPGIKLRWVDGTRRVEIVFCFECSTLYLYSGEGQRVQREFDPAEKALVAIMKRIFSGDPQIQRLK
jgi:hypothetical protein